MRGWDAGTDCGDIIARDLNFANRARASRISSRSASLPAGTSSSGFSRRDSDLCHRVDARFPHRSTRGLERADAMRTF